jgi:hypothetical protein
VGKAGEHCVRVHGSGIDESVAFGEIKVVPFLDSMGDSITVEPGRNFDVGAGKGKPVTVTKFDKSRGSRNQTTNLIEGTVGLIIDARGRPYNFELGTPGRIEALRSFLTAFGLPLPK